MSNFSPDSKPRLAEGIYLVTDPAMSMARIGQSPEPTSDSKSWHQLAIAETLSTCLAAVDAGVQVLQLRWKNVDAKYLFDLALAVSKMVADRAQIFINDRVDVYLAAKAAGAKITGVHIGQTDLSPKLVRQLITADGLLGLSAASKTELEQSALLGEIIDCLGVGVVRSTDTKPDSPPPLGIAGIARIAEQSAYPVVAIGGIKAGDIAQLAKSKVHSAAVVSAIVAANDPGAAAGELVNIWRENRG